ncbi:MAG: DHH family phosphoesterase [Ruminococcus sp.]|nr:DHH family phosphoesterase [Ruminococcus sp.]
MKNKFPAALFVVQLLLLADVAVSAVLLHKYNDWLGVVCLVPAVLLIILGLIVYAVFTKNSFRHISKMNKHLENSAAEYMNTLPAPVAVIDENKNFVWFNQIFTEKISLGQDVYGLDFEGFVSIDINNLLSEGFAVCHINGCIYKISAEKYDKMNMSFHVLYFQDQTDYYTVKKKSDDSHQNVVIITIDNYDEIMQNAKESVKSQTSLETEKIIENFMLSTKGLVKKTSSNTFYAIIENCNMKKVIDEKFKILDEARSIKISDNYPITFSIGVGLGADSLQESEKIAKQCIDMALGRGGDQAVIKTENGYRFFGGVSKGIEKRSHAKTRVIANALQDIIRDSGKVFIMGHRFGDLDSVGASCGMAGAIRLLGKKAFVAVDRSKNLASHLISEIEDKTNDQLFITPGEAESYIEDRDLLIIVDTHNKDFLESRSLYDRAKNIVVIDHHRKTVNFIDDAVIFHHEPYASSASEMVTEIIQYFRFDTDQRFPNCYADALLSGIMLDTKNFVMRTGVRTFEAAAYLKKLGADTVAVKLLFSNSIDSYKRRSQIVSTAKIHRNCAIAAADFKSDDLRLVAPQAADELLSITGVDASFVIYKTGSTLNISARSLGAVNVQVIMEELGGGGHQTMAATQIEGSTVQEAVKALIHAIDARLEDE